MKRTENEREQVRTVAERWRKAYQRGNGEWFAHRSDKRTRAGIYAELQALDVETASDDDVAAIIGNRSWCEPAQCDDCGERSWYSVQVGQEPDYESSTAVLCVACLRKALALAEAP